MQANWLKLIDNNEYFSRNNQHDYELFECCLNGAASFECENPEWWDEMKTALMKQRRIEEHQEAFKSISVWFVQESEHLLDFMQEYPATYLQQMMLQTIMMILLWDLDELLVNSKEVPNLLVEKVVLVVQIQLVLHTHKWPWTVS